MGQFQVTEIEGSPGSWSSKGGNNYYSYDCVLDDNGTTIQISLPTDWKELAVGDQVQGEPKYDGKGWKFDMDFKAMAALFKGGTPPSPSFGGQSTPAPSQTAPAASQEDKMRSKEACIRGDAVQAAASIAGPGASPDSIFSNAEIIYHYIVTGEFSNDGNPPF